MLGVETALSSKHKLSPLHTQHALQALRLPTTRPTCFQLQIQLLASDRPNAPMPDSTSPLSPGVPTVCEHRVAKLAFGSLASHCETGKICLFSLSWRFLYSAIYKDLILFMHLKSFIFCETFFPYLALASELLGSFSSLVPGSLYFP